MAQPAVPALRLQGQRLIEQKVDEPKIFSQLLVFPKVPGIEATQMKMARNKYRAECREQGVECELWGWAEDEEVAPLPPNLKWPENPIKLVTTLRCPECREVFRPPSAGLWWPKPLEASSSSSA